MRWSAISPRSSSGGPGRSAFRPAPDRLGVLRRDLREPPHRDRQVHRPPDADDLLGEQDVAVRRPIRRLHALEVGQPEVVGHDARDLAVPGARLGRLLELLIDRSEEREPDERANEVEKILHARMSGAGVVPGFTSGTPWAHWGQASGAYVGMETS